MMMYMKANLRISAVCVKNKKLKGGILLWRKRKRIYG